ncbi:hypothetical protein NLU13_5345 [Sarocladium strictum]|uniref:Uncharacterized protein n=1 Tax=Sarocladium strictum TaxID=5046 RepID=A0AA39L748_SARSR|nr:hypothetical protein NLU13_5345 [Sarocladium strictum]
MEREAYQPPTASGPPRGANSDALDGRANMIYICGDCGNHVSIRKDSNIACPACAGRVLYKQRTKRMVQFEAR